MNNYLLMHSTKWNLKIYESVFYGMFFKEMSIKPTTIVLETDKNLP